MHVFHETVWSPVALQQASCSAAEGVAKELQEKMADLQEQMLSQQEVSHVSFITKIYEKSLILISLFGFQVRILDRIIIMDCQTAYLLVNPCGFCVIWTHNIRDGLLFGAEDVSCLVIDSLFDPCACSAIRHESLFGHQDTVFVHLFACCSYLYFIRLCCLPACWGQHQATVSTPGEPGWGWQCTDRVYLTQGTAVITATRTTGRTCACFPSSVLTAQGGGMDSTSTTLLLCKCPPPFWGSYCRGVSVIILQLPWGSRSGVIAHLQFRPLLMCIALGANYGHGIHSVSCTHRRSVEARMRPV